MFLFTGAVRQLAEKEPVVYILYIESYSVLVVVPRASSTQNRLEGYISVI